MKISENSFASYSISAPTKTKCNNNTIVISEQWLVVTMAPMMAYKLVNGNPLVTRVI
jgi:hypothetical protein